MCWGWSDVFLDGLEKHRLDIFGEVADKLITLPLWAEQHALLGIERCVFFEICHFQIVILPYWNNWQNMVYYSSNKCQKKV